MKIQYINVKIKLNYFFLLFFFNLLLVSYVENEKSSQINFYIFMFYQIANPAITNKMGNFEIMKKKNGVKKNSLKLWKKGNLKLDC